MFEIVRCFDSAEAFENAFQRKTTLMRCVRIGQQQYSVPLNQNVVAARHLENGKSLHTTFRNALKKKKGFNGKMGENGHDYLDS